MKTRKINEGRPTIESLEARECFSVAPLPGFSGGVTVAAGDVNGVHAAMGDGSVRFLHDPLPVPVLSTSIGQIVSK